MPEGGGGVAGAKVLVVGGGGREHALVWKLVRSERVAGVDCAPGNAGIARLARCLPVEADDVEGLTALVERERYDLVVVGPEAPLVAGVADRLAALGVPCFGPRRAAAAIEGSKVFAKVFMARHGIPTAPFRVFDDPLEASAYAERRLAAGDAVVLKVDGLAAGKGVLVTEEPREAVAWIQEVMVRAAFGAAGRRVVVEERLAGEEVSVLALVDGERFLTLLPAQDHKRAWDGDRGPNTGGMGAYCPVPFVDRELLRRVEERVLGPAVRGLAAEGAPYRGVLYAGLMLTDRGPMVLEFNCRFGDPETQAVLPLLESDLYLLARACAEGDLGGLEVRWRAGAAACVVLAAGGYPGPYERGLPVTGLAEAERLPGVLVFHAGTAAADGGIVTAGGRVLGVTALGADVRTALARAYEAAALVSFPGVHYRRDIGRRALRDANARSAGRRGADR